MKAPPSVAIVGPGAIGATLASFLRRAGADVALIGRRPGRVTVTGLAPTGKTLGARARVPAACDFVFFCVKSADTGSAIRRARRSVGPNSTVVSLQNGLGHRAPLLRAFGRKRCVFGVCVIGAERTSYSTVKYHGGRGVAIARLRANAGRAEQVARLLRKAGLEVTIDASEDRLLWMKAAFNAATNPLGALTGAKNGELIRVPAMRELAFGALREAVAAARAAGQPLSYPDLSRRMAAGLSAMKDQSNSMLQDLRTGRRTELDAIVKPLLDAARRRRQPAPILESLYRFTKRLERELA